MNIGVIGIGGVGGYFGGKLTRLITGGDDRVYFVARGTHLAEIQANGLVLDSGEGVFNCRPTLATDRISELPGLDLCFICVKSYDLDNVLEQLKPKISSTTMIIPLLNGVDIYERVRAVIKDGVVFPACVYVGTHIEVPGKVTQRGGAGRIIFGKDPQNPYFNPVLFEVFKEAGISYSLTDFPDSEIWGKFLFIAPFGLVAAAFNKTLGEVLDSSELSGLVKNIMNEILAIAAKKQIIMLRSIIEDAFAKARKFPYDTKTSFQRDYEVKEKPDERDLFGGAVIRMGKQTEVPTGTTVKIYNSLEERKPQITY